MSANPAAVLQKVRTKPGLLGDFNEPAAAKVAVQPLIASAGDKQVVAAVAVKVSYGDPHRIRRPRAAGAVGDVGEPSKPVVAIEPARRVGSTRLGNGRAAVAKIQVEPAVVIRVEKGAAAHGLGRVVLAWRAVAEPKSNSGLGGDVLKPNPPGPIIAAGRPIDHSQPDRNNKQP